MLMLLLMMIITEVIMIITVIIIRMRVEGGNNNDHSAVSRSVSVERMEWLDGLCRAVQRWSQAALQAAPGL